MRQRSWRSRAAEIIGLVLEETRGRPEAEIRQALFDAYPFGERRYHPYKIWLDEINRQRKVATDFKSTPLFGDQQ